MLTNFQFAITMWLLYVSLLVLFIYILDKILLDPRLLELGEKFNGPKRWPIVGNALMFIGVGPSGEIWKIKWTLNRSKMLYKCFEKRWNRWIAVFTRKFNENLKKIL